MKIINKIKLFIEIVKLLLFKPHIFFAMYMFITMIEQFRGRYYGKKQC